MNYPVLTDRILGGKRDKCLEEMEINVAKEDALKGCTICEIFELCRMYSYLAKGVKIAAKYS